MSARKLQAALTREKILNVARSKIRSEGYDNIRIVDIAKACNMSAGNFYNYFKSLDELFNEVDSVKYYESFRSLQTESSLPVFERIESYFIDWIDLALNQYGPDYMYNWTRRYTRKDTSDSSDSRVGLIVKHVTLMLEEGIENGELLPSIPMEDIAYTIAFLLFGCSAHFGITKEGDFIEKWSHNFCKIFVNPTLAPYLCHPAS